MSAETLRRAAALVRERADAALGDPPTADSWYRAEEIADVLAGGAIATEAQAVKDAPHIASWHPAVALAVADMLEAEARIAEKTGVFMGREALAVARAYLGESA